MLGTTLFVRRFGSANDTVPTSMDRPGYADSEALFGDTALLHRTRELNALRDAQAAARGARQPARRC